MASSQKNKHINECEWEEKQVEGLKGKIRINKLSS
jgi:hypothetical protein